MPKLYTLSMGIQRSHDRSFLRGKPYSLNSKSLDINPKRYEHNRSIIYLYTFTTPSKEERKLPKPLLSHRASHPQSTTHNPHSPLHTPTKPQNQHDTPVHQLQGPGARSVIRYSARALFTSLRRNSVPHTHIRSGPREPCFSACNV